VKSSLVKRALFRLEAPTLLPFALASTAITFLAALAFVILLPCFC